MIKTNGTGKVQFEKLLDFAHLTVRALELYDSIRSSTTRELLLSELHQRYRHLDGCIEMKQFQAHLTLISRLLNEIPSQPEHVEAAVECASQLIEFIERRLIAQMNEDAA
ncbi:MAG: hypothetical protein HY587_03595 [Candidatus Omnitrophica bacterium]|nr:hypothetical protein [Candidatus Omnitrophota bacterium]